MVVVVYYIIITNLQKHSKTDDGKQEMNFRLLYSD